MANNQLCATKQQLLLLAPSDIPSSCCCCIGKEVAWCWMAQSCTNLELKRFSAQSLSCLLLSNGIENLSRPNYLLLFHLSIKIWDFKLRIIWTWSQIYSLVSSNNSNQTGKQLNNNNCALVKFTRQTFEERRKLARIMMMMMTTAAMCIHFQLTNQAKL